ncbi:Glutathione-independent glyoxalase HSP31 [Mycena kentingensis (nom. inval.)]|nr:Glutathione-independent glyoxalase HSP31 [Mycena kentingensis (nom. inval.)]
MPCILFVFTSANKTLKGNPTGWYLPEAAHPYYILAPSYSIEFASPAGPNPPIDEGSVTAFAGDAESVKFLNDETVKSKLASAKKLSDLKVDDYDAIFYVGGHGPCMDLAEDPENIAFASKVCDPAQTEPGLIESKFYQTGKVTSAVCHGPAALVGATDAEGRSIFAGKAVTGFSNEEEGIVKKVDDIPFSLENRIVELGGMYERAANWQPKVVVSGSLITGQNPASAAGVGQAILEALTK